MCFLKMQCACREYSLKAEEGHANSYQQHFVNFRYKSNCSSGESAGSGGAFSVHALQTYQPVWGQAVNRKGQERN